MKLKKHINWRLVYYVLSMLFFFLRLPATFNSLSENWGLTLLPNQEDAIYMATQKSEKFNTYLDLQTFEEEAFSD